MMLAMQVSAPFLVAGPDRRPGRLDPPGGDADPGAHAHFIPKMIVTGVVVIDRRPLDARRRSSLHDDLFTQIPRSSARSLQVMRSIHLWRS